LNAKWRRLYNAFAGWQNKHQCSNHLLKFIQAAMQPGLTTDWNGLAETLRIGPPDTLNYISV